MDLKISYKIRSLSLCVATLICKGGTATAAECSASTRTPNEQLFELVEESLNQLIGSCAFHDHNPCKLSPDDRVLVQKIYQDFGAEHGGLCFVSERANPGFFLLDGQVRIAKTGSSVGDPIFINQDIVNDDDHHQDKKAGLDVAAILGILVHEFGHHHGELDHQRLDRIGALIRSYSKKNTQLLQFDIATHQSMQAMVINHSPLQDLLKAPQSTVSVFVFDGIKWFDFSKEMAASTAPCNFIRRWDQPRPADTLWLDNMFVATNFEMPHNPDTSDPQQTIYYAVLNGPVQMTCKDSESVSRPESDMVYIFSIILPFAEKTSDKSIKLLREKSFMHFQDCQIIYQDGHRYDFCPGP